MTNPLLSPDALFPCETDADDDLGVLLAVACNELVLARDARFASTGDDASFD